MNDIGDIFKKQLENYQPEDNGALWQRLEHHLDAEAVIPKAKQVKWKPWYTVASAAASVAVVVTAGVLWYNASTNDSGLAEKQTDQTEQLINQPDSLHENTLPIQSVNNTEVAQNETQETLERQEGKNTQVLPTTLHDQNMQVPTNTTTKGTITKTNPNQATPDPSTHNKPYIQSDYTANNIAANTFPENIGVTYGVTQSVTNTPQQASNQQSPTQQAAGNNNSPKSIPIDSVKAAQAKNTQAEQKTVDNLADNIDNTIKNAVKETVNKDLELIVSTFVTPNHDGHNDIFEVKNLENYDGNRLMVFNRAGTKIYDRINYNNDWYCDELAQGTYFYTLQVKKDGKSSVKQGSFVVMR